MLELVQQKYLQIIIGEGRNNFILEYNDHREDIAPTDIEPEQLN
jgi:segregation and condensation protein A